MAELALIGPYLASGYVMRLDFSIGARYCVACLVGSEGVRCNSDGLRKHWRSCSPYY